MMALTSVSIDGMATLYVRNVPDEVLRRVKVNAATAGLSVQAYVLALIGEGPTAREAKAGDITVRTLQKAYARDAKPRRTVQAAPMPAGGGGGNPPCAGVIVSREYAHLIGQPCQLDADHAGKCGPSSTTTTP